MAKSEPKILQATIEQSGDELSITWDLDGQESDFEENYNVPMDTLLRRSNDVVDALRRLEGTDWSDESGAELIPLLHVLAEKGAAQYETLMTGIGETAKAASRFRNWFETEVTPNGADWRIQVVHKQYDAPLICWGLTYTKPTDFNVSNMGMGWEDYPGFWALTHKLSCRSILRREANRLKAPLGENETRIPLTIEVGDLKEHTDKMNPGERNDVSEQVAHTVQRFQRFAQTYEKYNVFWYLSLEQEDNVYLVDDEEINVASVEEVRKRISRILIMFLDGGSVIRGKRGWHWVNVLLDQGRTGLISAEVDIQNSQLKFFGWEVLRDVINAKLPFLDAFDDARKKYWPQSLLYGVYCDPLGVYFNPPPEKELAAAESFLNRVRDFVKMT